MTDQTHSVTITRESWMGSGKTRKIEQTITYPEGCTLHFESSQQCLTIRDQGGQVLAAFVGLRRYKTNLVDVGEEIITEPAS